MVELLSTSVVPSAVVPTVESMSLKSSALARESFVPSGTEDPEIAAAGTSEESTESAATGASKESTEVQAGGAIEESTAQVRGRQNFRLPAQWRNRQKLNPLDRGFWHRFEEQFAAYVRDVRADILC
jgi:hypothetical protein